MNNLRLNLISAEMAVRETTKILSIGSDNREDRSFFQRERAAWCVGPLKKDIMMADADLKAKGAGKLERIMMWANKARDARCGNCGEHAAVAFTELLLSSCYPLDFVYLNGTDHNFVLIGRTGGGFNEGVIEDYPTWGPETVVCDPYMEEFYEASFYPRRMYDSGTHKVGLFYRQSTGPFSVLPP